MQCTIGSRDVLSALAKLSPVRMNLPFIIHEYDCSFMLRPWKLCISYMSSNCPCRPYRKHGIKKVVLICNVNMHVDKCDHMLNIKQLYCMVAVVHLFPRDCFVLLFQPSFYIYHELETKKKMHWTIFNSCGLNIVINWNRRAHFCGHLSNRLQGTHMAWSISLTNLSLVEQTLAYTMEWWTSFVNTAGPAKHWSSTDAWYVHFWRYYCEWRHSISCQIIYDCCDRWYWQNMLGLQYQERKKDR